MRQGDIIGYSPDLDIHTQITGDIAGAPTRTYTLADESVYNTVKSRTAYEFEKQSPAKKVQNALNLITRIETYMSNIEASATSNDYLIKYFAAATEEDAAKIAKLNSDDMENGSTKLEVYTELQNILTEVRNILELYITSIFGKDVDVESVEEIVSNYIDRINHYEAQEEYEKINYFGLYYDTQISYIFSEYLDRMTEVSAELSFINDKQRKLDVNDMNASLFKTAFDKVNNVLSGDLLKDNSDEEVQKSMKNIYIIKQEIEGYLDVFSTIYQLEDGQSEITEIQQDSIDNLESKLDALLKTTMYSNLSKKDICSDLKKKSNYRSFFVT